MLRKRVVVLLVAVILGILVSCRESFKGSSVAFADGDSQPLAYAPINITNTQSIATPNPFQVMVDVDSSEFAAYEAADLSNVAFAYSNGTVIPSWLESGNRNSSTDTVYWLKVGSIPAESSITVNIAFYPIEDNILNNRTTGEAPDLSTPRGQYDNGPNVFTAYGDFINGLNGWQVSAYYGSFTPVSSSNGIKMLDGNAGESAYLTSTASLPPIPIEIVEAWDYNGQYDSHALSIGPSPFSTSNTLISGDGYAPVLNNSVSATFDFLGDWTELYDYATNQQVSRSSFTGGGSFSVVSFLRFNGTWASAGYTNQNASLEDFGSVLIPTVVSGQSPHTLSNQALIIGAANHAYSLIWVSPPSTQYIRWVIARALPPNGVAPSVAVGNVTIVPEFPSFLILPLFMIATLLGVIIFKRKRNIKK
jgi:hypothetical protein